MKPKHFITYGIWNPKVPTNPFLIPNALASLGHRVLFVEQTLWDKKRMLAPWSWGATEVHRERDTIYRTVMRPPLPRKTEGLRRWFNEYAGRQLRKVMNEIGFPEKDYYQLIFSPAEKYGLDWLPEAPFIYRVIDDYTAMPLYAGDPGAAAREDEWLARNAVAVFPSNPKLFDMKQPLNRNTHLVPNAVNFDHFANAPAETPDDLKSLPRPLIGFAGALDRYKMDFDLIGECARLRPDWSFVMLGDVGISDGTSRADLPNLPNIHYMGFRAYKDLPRYLRALDVGLVPYVRNSYTEGVFPLKLYEYFAVGLPVVSTDLPFLRSAGEAVMVGSTPAEFNRAIETALSESVRGAATSRVELARQNSWLERARQITTLLDELER